MALLPQSGDGTQWQMTTIDFDVLLIRNPGIDEEEVHFKFDGTDLKNYRVIRESIIHSQWLNAIQKYEAMFWLGYFYSRFNPRQ